MKKLFLIFITCLVYNSLFSQENEENSEQYLYHYPQSPAVAGLGQFGEVPVSLSTGLPQISIPIYTISEGNLSVPITLDYHASGVRIQDPTGTVGVKWSLNAGGQITANEVRHNLYYSQAKVDLDFIMSSKQNIVDTIFTHHEKMSQPDLMGGFFKPEHFSYNFMGKNGDFFLQKDEPLFFTPKQNKLLFDGFDYMDNYSVNNNFNPDNKTKIITDEFGVKYTFDEKEIIRTSSYEEKTLQSGNYYSVPGLPVTYTSAYFLGEIKSPHGHVIDFQYSNNNYTNNHVLVNEYAYLNGLNQPYDHPAYPLNTGEVYSLSTYESKKLDKIVAKNVQVVFEYVDKVSMDYDRYGGENSYSSPFISSITILDNNSVQLKKYVLEYAYNGRWNLKKVRVFDRNDNEMPGYEMDYKGGVSSITIPEHYNSKSVDYFGFNNGEDNPSIVPTRFFGKTYIKTRVNSSGNNISFQDYEFIEFGDANRFSDFSLSSIGIIESVVYPTGGSSHFTFEPHKVIKASQLCESFFNQITPCEGTGCQDIDYPIDEVNGYSIGGHRISSIVNKDSDGVIVSEKLYEYHNGKLLIEPEYMTTNQVVYCENGIYVYGEATNQYSLNQHVKGNSSPVNNVNMLGNVVYDRVIERQVGNGYTQYEFTNKTNTNHIVDTGGIYMDLITTNVRNDNAPFSAKTYRAKRLAKKSVFSESNNLLLEEIINYPIESGTLNAPENEYIFGMLAGEFSVHGPDLPYKLDITHFDLAALPNFVYHFDEREYFPSICVLLHDYPDLYTSGENISLYELDFYSIESSFIDPISKETIKYGKNGKELKIQEEYTYDPDFHLLQETIVKNNGELVSRSKTYYPDDVDELTEISSSDKSWIEILSNPNVHRIAEPIQIEQEGISQGIKKIHYVPFNSPGAPPLPRRIYNKRFNTDSFEETIVFNGYDQYGNPKEVSKTDGTPISYIWGYNNSKVVAMLQGASYSDIDSNLIASIQSKSDVDIDAGSEQSLRDELDVLRQAFQNQNVLVTTYTHDIGTGVTSETDPRGNTIYYLYDENQRLKMVLDDEKNVLSKNEYNYGSQN